MVLTTSATHRAAYESIMILENPIGLWALSAIIAVLILHRLRQRPERRQVSSLIIWKRIERLLTIAPVRPKSRLYLILMLQILAVIGLAIALARPIWRATQPEPLHLVFLIDNSASMGSLSPYLRNNLPYGPRWNYLVWEIKDMMAGSPVDTTVSLYQVPPLKSFIGLKRQEVNSVLDSLNQMNIPSDLESLVALVQGVKGEFYFCSDKLPPEAIMERFPQKPHLILVGNPYPNQAIIRASATPVSGKSDYYDVFAVVKNYSRDQTARVKLDLFYLTDDKVEIKLGRQESEGPVNESRNFFFREISLPNQPVITISIKPYSPYDLACDNQVWLVPPRPCKVNMAGKDNPALTKALKAIPSVSLNSKADVSDIIVFNEISYAILKDETGQASVATKFIIINTVPDINKEFWDYQGRLERPLVTGIDTSSPILKYCDLNVFNSIPYALKLLPKEKEYIKPIINVSSVSEDECVLIGEWRKGNWHLVFLNFPLEWRSQTSPTDWTLTPSFPIFWTNLINYLHPISKDYQVSEGLCNEAESDNNGVTVLDTNLPGQAEIEASRVELGSWLIGLAGLLFLLGWISAKNK